MNDQTYYPDEITGMYKRADYATVKGDGTHVYICNDKNISVYGYDDATYYLGDTIELPEFNNLTRSQYKKIIDIYEGRFN